METSQIVCVVEYDGTNYHGFQSQLALPTIQGEIEKALLKLSREETRVAAASRTDAGVHARGQMVSFRTRSTLAPATFVRGLNHYLPVDIAVKAAYRMDDAFDVRRDAISREYRYYILNSPTRSPIREGFSYRVSGHLDIEAMNRACHALIGEHDFALFASSLGDEIKSTVRRVYRAEMEREEELAVLCMVANAFLPHQVRNTIGTLIKVGLGRMAVAEFCSIMEANNAELVGPAAPAHGLCLRRVSYPNQFKEEA